VGREVGSADADVILLACSDASERGAVGCAPGTIGIIARLSMRVGERLAITSVQCMILSEVLVAGAPVWRDVVRVTRLSRDEDGADAFP